MISLSVLKADQKCSREICASDRGENAPSSVRVLILSLFQGLKELRLRNWDNLPIDVEKIDAVVITHAHIDHSGYLPRLVKSGFAGPIHCTTATADLLRILLLDSAKLQEEEANYARKKGYSKHDNPKPLYTTEDAESVFPLLQSHDFLKSVELMPGIVIKFYYAGHILGAACIEFSIQGKTQEKKILFLGRQWRTWTSIDRVSERKEEAMDIMNTYCFLILSC